MFLLGSNLFPVITCAILHQSTELMKSGNEIADIWCTIVPITNEAL